MATKWVAQMPPPAALPAVASQLSRARPAVARARATTESAV